MRRPLPEFHSIAARAAGMSGDTPAARLVALARRDGERANMPDDVARATVIAARIEELSPLLNSIVPVVRLLHAAGDEESSSLENTALKTVRALAHRLDLHERPLLYLVVAADLVRVDEVCETCPTDRRDRHDRSRYVLRCAPVHSRFVACSRCWRDDLEAFGFFRFEERTSPRAASVPPPALAGASSCGGGS